MSKFTKEEWGSLLWVLSYLFREQPFKEVLEFEKTYFKDDDILMGSLTVHAIKRRKDYKKLLEEIIGKPIPFHSRVAEGVKILASRGG